MSGRVLAEARRLLEAATPGPWHIEPESPLGPRVVWAGQFPIIWACLDDPPPEYGLSGSADAALIAAARSLLPSLLNFADEIARLADEPDDVQEWENEAWRGVRQVGVVDVSRLRAALSRLAWSGGDS